MAYSTSRNESSINYTTFIASTGRLAQQYNVLSHLIFNDEKGDLIMSRAILLTLILLAVLLVGCTITNSITKTEAEEIALKYVEDNNESSHWVMDSTEQADNYWIVRFGPTNEMPELLWFHIDKKTGEIIKVITDS
jgi:ABC-type iron transport system FetAB ATPase subunit